MFLLEEIFILTNKKKKEKTYKFPKSSRYLTINLKKIKIIKKQSD